MDFCTSTFGLLVLAGLFCALGGLLGYGREHHLPDIPEQDGP